MVVGVALVVRGVLDVQARGEALFVFLGADLAALGVVVVFVNRWQEKRGL